MPGNWEGPGGLCVQTLAGEVGSWGTKEGREGPGQLEGLAKAERGGPPALSSWVSPALCCLWAMQTSWLGA